jgi:hypothetical protein
MADGRRQTADGRRQTAGDGIFFFVQIGFSSIKSPNSSRKSINFFFWKLRNQYFILTSFIESKKLILIFDEKMESDARYM